MSPWRHLDNPIHTTFKRGRTCPDWQRAAVERRSQSREQSQSSGGWREPGEVCPLPATPTPEPIAPHTTHTSPQRGTSTPPPQDSGGPVLVRPVQDDAHPTVGGCGHRLHSPAGQDCWDWGPLHGHNPMSNTTTTDVGLSNTTTDIGLSNTTTEM